MPDEPADPKGCPTKPLKVRCTSVGRPSLTKPYWSIVAEDGQQFCFSMSFDQARLINAQTADVIAGWPVDAA